MPKTTVHLPNGAPDTARDLLDFVPILSSHLLLGPVAMLRVAALVEVRAQFGLAVAARVGLAQRRGRDVVPRSDPPLIRRGPGALHLNIG